MLVIHESKIDSRSKSLIAHAASFKIGTYFYVIDANHDSHMSRIISLDKEGYFILQWSSNSLSSPTKWRLESIRHSNNLIYWRLLR